MLIFTPLAQEELLDAQAWYEDKAVGLGRRFRAALEVAIHRIQANPMQFPLVHRSIRRALVRHFPYALFFLVEADGSITVIACFHGSRDPIQWQRR